MKYNFVYYFNQFTKLFQHFMVLKTQSQNGNLRDCHMKDLRMLISICPKLRLRLKVKGSCLKHEDKEPFTPKNMVNLFIVYELDAWSRDLDTDFTLTDCLFESVKLTKNADPDKDKYSDYGIRFDLIGLDKS